MSQYRLVHALFNWHELLLFRKRRDKSTLRRYRKFQASVEVVHYGGHSMLVANFCMGLHSVISGVDQNCYPCQGNNPVLIE